LLCLQMRKDRQIISLNRETIMFFRIYSTSGRVLFTWHMFTFYEKDCQIYQSKSNTHVRLYFSQLPCTFFRNSLRIESFGKTLLEICKPSNKVGSVAKSVCNDVFNIYFDLKEKSLYSQIFPSVNPDNTFIHSLVFWFKFRWL
jgi:hypothetical protein